MKNFLFLITLVVRLQAVDTLFVTYGSKPQHELIVRYIDDKKEGYLFVKGPDGLKEQKGDCLPFGKKHYLHRWCLGNLESGQKITFYAGITKDSYSVSTLKHGDLSFCVAGDLYRNIKPYRQGIEAMASENPDFVVFGGDLAYTSHGPVHFPSKEFAIKRYITFFKVIAEKLKKQTGELIPIIAAVGNHDYKKGENEYVIDLFFPPYSKTYFSYDLGKNLDLIILDTGHVAPLQGLQLGFLKQALAQSQKAYKLAVYHVGAYPSVYSYESSSAKNVREAFCALFDEYQLTFAFEHHSHAFKVTHPIKYNLINPEGTIYLGDGCVGVKPRSPRNKKAWYIENAQAERHYFKVSVQDTIKVEAKDLNSKSIHPVIERSFQKQQMIAPQTEPDSSDQIDSEKEPQDL